MDPIHAELQLSIALKAHDCATILNGKAAPIKRQICLRITNRIAIVHVVEPKPLRRVVDVSSLSGEEAVVSLGLEVCFNQRQKANYKCVHY